ncbi:hypothetical protein B0H14DRAFT_2621261 [Mycena olivaceomarginata]|nr:hypothetical protein B0H14DRAFT_2621261 [Mycena olivaceomarginata]
MAEELAELSALSKRKFYVVKKGAPGTEAIYSHCPCDDGNDLSSAVYSSDAAAFTTGFGRDFQNAQGRFTTIRCAPNITRASDTPASQIYRVSGSPRVLIHAAAAEAELRDSGGTASLLVGTSLADVEDDDEVSVGDTPHFYRVFGSPRVQSSRHPGGWVIGGGVFKCRGRITLLDRHEKKKPRGTSIESNKLPTNYEHLRITTTGASHADLISPLSKPQPRPRSSQAATGVGTQAGSLRRVKQFYNQERVGTHAGSGSEGALEER